MKSERKNASRFGREPVIGKTGKPIVPKMARGQIAIVEFLRRNRYATFKDIHAFVGGDKTTVRRNIRILKATHVAYIKVCDQHAKERNLSRPILYELDKNGIAYFTGDPKRAIERPPSVNFDHAALASHATAQLEIGINGCPYARLITWPEIKASKNIPKRTAELERPFGIPYFDPEASDDKTPDLVWGVANRHANGDAPVCGIELTLPDRKKFRFLDWEADTGSESENVVRSKFRAWLIIEESLDYQLHFGFPKGSFFVPFLCDRLYQTDRVKWLMDILSDMTGGKGSKLLMFMRFKRDGTPGYVFNEPWERVGHDPIILSQ